jgi:organic hydroperoxide reductase OsmC/OhrA
MRWANTLATRGVGLADAAAFDRAAHEAERNCPVSRALQGNVEIRVHATLDAPSTDGA